MGQHVNSKIIWGWALKDVKAALFKLLMALDAAKFEELFGEFKIDQKDEEQVAGLASDVECTSVSLGLSAYVPGASFQIHTLFSSMSSNAEPEYYYAIELEHFMFGGVHECDPTAWVAAIDAIKNGKPMIAKGRKGQDVETAVDLAKAEAMAEELGVEGEPKFFNHLLLI